MQALCPVIRPESPCANEYNVDKAAAARNIESVGRDFFKMEINRAHNTMSQRGAHASTPP